MSVGPILLATRSSGKLRELRPLFASYGLDVMDPDEAGLAEDAGEDAVEAFSTFEENALAKARFFFEWTGHPTAADDSGLAVDALGGAPGVRSKRWSSRADLIGVALDDENNRTLLRALARVTHREARYVCAAAFVDGDREYVERGEAAGVITVAPRGQSGFGYDPYFLADELRRTFGEASLEEKQRVSHRARAFRRLLARVVERG